MISVVIPSYNHASSLVACIESVKAQEGVETEIIVVDDGSTDDTQEVLSKHVTRGEVTLLSQSNQGSNPARNRGAERAKGEFIIFVDADTVFVDTAFRKLLEALQSNRDAGFAYSDFRFGWKLFKTGEFDPERLRKLNDIPISALIRKKDFPGFDESLKRFQDWDIWLTMLESGKVGVHVPEELFKVTIERAGISSWLPKYSYSIPWRWFFGIRERVQAYEEARDIVRKKHDLH